MPIEKLKEESPIVAELREEFAEELRAENAVVSMPEFDLKKSPSKNLELMQQFVKSCPEDQRMTVFRMYEAYRKTRYLALHEAASKRHKQKEFSGISLKMD